MLGDCSPSLRPSHSSLLSSYPPCSPNEVPDGACASHPSSLPRLGDLYLSFSFALPGEDRREKVCSENLCHEIKPQRDHLKPSRNNFGDRCCHAEFRHRESFPDQRHAVNNVTDTSCVFDVFYTTALSLSAQTTSIPHSTVLFGVAGTKGVSSSRR